MEPTMATTTGTTGGMSVAGKTKKQDLALTPEQEKELEKYVRLAYKVANTYRNFTGETDALLEVDDLVQLSLIAILEGIKRWGIKNVRYKQRAGWACMNARRVVKRRREIASFISIDHIEEKGATRSGVIDEEYDKRVGHVPDYDRYELLSYAEDFIASLPCRDKMILEHLFALNDAEYLRDTEIAEKFKMPWRTYWSKRRKLIQRLRNAPKVKEILECRN